MPDPAAATSPQILFSLVSTVSSCDTAANEARISENRGHTDGCSRGSNVCSVRGGKEVVVKRKEDKEGLGQVLGGERR